MAFKLNRRSSIRPASGAGGLHLGGAPYEGAPESRTPQRVAVAVAVVLHALLFVIALPDSGPRAFEPAQAQKVFAVKAVRFKPPPPARAEPVPKRKAKRIPVPDPTPDDPEPLVREEIRDAPRVEIDGFVDEIFPLPEAPRPSAPPGTMWVEGQVMAPVKQHAPRPGFTEEARQARIQGVVILRVVIDAMGNVGHVKVLKGLPAGLTEAAVEAVRQWRYQPATLHGEKVPVYMNLTVQFSQQ